jgi:hypothetical protein
MKTFALFTIAVTGVAASGHGNNNAAVHYEGEIER